MSRAVAKAPSGLSAQIAKKKRIIPAAEVKAASEDDDQEQELPVFDGAEEETFASVTKVKKVATAATAVGQKTPLKQQQQQPIPPPPPPKDKEEATAAAVAADNDEEVEALFRDTELGVQPMDQGEDEEGGGDPGAEQLFDDPVLAAAAAGEEEELPKEKKRSSVTFKVPEAVPKKKKKDEKAFADALQTMSEKERCAAIAQYLGPVAAPAQTKKMPKVATMAEGAAAAVSASTGGEAATPTQTTHVKKQQQPPQPQKKKQQEQQQVLLPIFPHKDDQARVVQYVRIMTFSLLKTGTIGMIGDDASEEQNEAMHGAQIFYARCVKFRLQLLAGLKELVAANPYMSKIIPAMAVSKLVMFSTASKHLFAKGSAKKGSAASGGGGGGEEAAPPPAYCVWTGKVIPSEQNIRAAALVPIDQSLSHSSGLKQEEPLLAPVMFHLDSQYVNIFKCIHTLLFYMDYVTSEIHAKLESIRASLSSVVQDPFDGDAVWEEMKSKTDKKDPLFMLCASAQTQLVECVKVVKAVMHEKYLIVKTPRIEGQAN